MRNINIYSHRSFHVIFMVQMIISIRRLVTSFQAWCNDYTNSCKIQPLIYHKRNVYLQYTVPANHCDNLFTRMTLQDSLFGSWETMTVYRQSFCQVQISSFYHFWVNSVDFNTLFYSFTFTVDENDEVSIETVARSIAKAFNFKGRIEFDTTKADGQFKKTASNKKLRSFRPDFQFTKFEDAIQNTVDWYLNNQDKVRNWFYPRRVNRKNRFRAKRIRSKNGIRLI